MMYIGDIIIYSLLLIKKYIKIIINEIVENY